MNTNATTYAGVATMVLAGVPALGHAPGSLPQLVAVVIFSVGAAIAVVPALMESFGFRPRVSRF